MVHDYFAVQGFFNDRRKLAAKWLDEQTLRTMDRWFFEESGRPRSVDPSDPQWLFKELSLEFSERYAHVADRNEGVRIAQRCYQTGLRVLDQHLSWYEEDRTAGIEDDDSMALAPLKHCFVLALRRARFVRQSDVAALTTSELLKRCKGKGIGPAYAREVFVGLAHLSPGLNQAGLGASNSDGGTEKPSYWAGLD